MAIRRAVLVVSTRIAGLLIVLVAISVPSALSVQVNGFVIAFRTPSVSHGPPGKLMVRPVGPSWNETVGGPIG
jgi:hypothetical protein